MTLRTRAAVSGRTTLEPLMTFDTVALETPATRHAFEQAGVVKLKGDWTNRDPEITSSLKELGRAGVPLYLFWAPGAERAKILPQVLTESLILSELSSIQQAKR